MGNEGTKFTRGPWSTFANIVWKTGVGGAAVALIAEPECAHSGNVKPVEVSSRRFDEAMANAALIAAAPDLYAALELALDAMVSADCGTVTVVPKLRAALSLARGERK